MLKMRDLTFKARYAVVARAGPAALSVPVAASAAPAPHGSHGSSGFGYGGGYVNDAQAFSSSNRHTDSSVKYQLDQTSSSNVTATNSAIATTSRCSDCGAIAIAFQVVISTGKNPDNINAKNTGNATSRNCTRCSTLAAAYQIIAGDYPSRLTRQQQQELSQIQNQLERLQHSRASVSQIESEADQLANQAVALLQSGATSNNTPSTSNGRDTRNTHNTANTQNLQNALVAAAPLSSGLVPAITPAASTNDSATSTSQPQVVLHEQVQAPPSSSS
jgi:hypothetical protein